MLPPTQPVKTDPTSVAFAVKCFLLQVVSVEELRSWAEHALVAGEDCPIFVEGVAEFDGSGEDVYRILGFVPDRLFSAEEESAIAGIAHLRQRPPGDEAVAGADTVLERHPEVLEEFRGVFPFVRLGQDLERETR